MKLVLFLLFLTSCSDVLGAIDVRRKDSRRVTPGDHSLTSGSIFSRLRPPNTFPERRFSRRKKKRTQLTSLVSFTGDITGCIDWTDGLPWDPYEDDCIEKVQSSVFYMQYTGGCSHFCKCGVDFSDPHVMSCPPGLYFKPMHPGGTCELPGWSRNPDTACLVPSHPEVGDFVNCIDWTDGELWDPYEDNCPDKLRRGVIYMELDGDCSKFCQCGIDQYQPHVLDCPVGLHFKSQPPGGTCQPTHWFLRPSTACIRDSVDDMPEFHDGEYKNCVDWEDGKLWNTSEDFCWDKVERGVFYMEYEGDCSRFCKCGVDFEYPHIMSCAPGLCFCPDARGGTCRRFTDECNPMETRQWFSGIDDDD